MDDFKMRLGIALECRRVPVDVSNIDVEGALGAVMEAHPDASDQELFLLVLDRVELIDAMLLS